VFAWTIFLFLLNLTQKIHSILRIATATCLYAITYSYSVIYVIEIIQKVFLWRSSLMPRSRIQFNISSHISVNSENRAWHANSNCHWIFPHNLHRSTPCLCFLVHINTKVCNFRREVHQEGCLPSGQLGCRIACSCTLYRVLPTRAAKDKMNSKCEASSFQFKSKLYLEQTLDYLK